MTLRSMVVLLLTMLAAPPLAGQSAWSTHTRAGEYAFARGDLDRAETEFQRALEMANGFPPGDRRLEASLSNLARLYEHESDFDRAQPMYQLLLAAVEHRVGPDDPALLDPLFAVARVSQPMGDLPTVTDSLRRYAAIAESSGDADPRQHWQALNMLAKMEVIEDRQNQALVWALRAAEIVGDDPRADDGERADLLESAANLAITQGDVSSAERLLAEVGELRTTGDSGDQTALTMAMGAATAFGAGQFDAAETLARRALASDPDPGTERMALVTLADATWARVDRGTDDLSILWAAAEPSLELDAARDALRELAELENGENPETLRRLVRVEVLRGEPGAAVIWQRRLIELGSMMEISTLHAHLDLATLLAAAGDSEKALAENANTIDLVEQEYGTSSTQVIPLLEQRVEIATDAGNKKEAKRAQKRLRKLGR
jgi:tetratricopeptide (TPR) repeat protein